VPDISHNKAKRITISKSKLGEKSCPSCHQAIFLTAKKCGHCGVHLNSFSSGYTRPSRKDSSTTPIILGTLVLTLFVMTGWGIYSLGLLDGLKKSHREGLKALSTIETMVSYTTAPITYDEYNRRLLDIKAEFDRHIFHIPPGTAHSHLNNAMTAYIEAATYWQGCIEASTYKRVPDTYSRYGSSFPVGRRYSEVGSEYLSIVWRYAHSEMRQAKRALQRK
jgi:hypothetical protein